MKKTFDAVLPYDKVEDHAYINAIGSNETEAAINADMCIEYDEIIKRLIYIKVKVIIQ